MRQQSLSVGHADGADGMHGTVGLVSRDALCGLDLCDFINV